MYHGRKVLEIPAIAPIKSCSTTACTSDNKGCTAFTITVDGTSVCTTFITLDAHGGLLTIDNRIGAYQCLECAHNENLLRSTFGITVIDGVCTSYEAR